MSSLDRLIANAGLEQARLDKRRLDTLEFDKAALAVREMGTQTMLPTTLGE
ncbi:MAG: hypothetical protein ACK2T3_14100 [Candidatus Promineifilaceae bacterium]